MPVGQVFGFLGPNGAGKSTTIRLMMGLYLPTAGRAELFGLDVQRHGPQVRRRIGYLPGELALHPRLTGRETLDRIARIRGDARPRDSAATWNGGSGPNWIGRCTPCRRATGRRSA